MSLPGIDFLIAKSLKDVVKHSLGDITFTKIEKRLFESYGIGFTQAVEDFGKLDVVLREFFGSGAEGIEKQIMNKILILEESKRNEKKWITLEDSRLIELMLKSLGDDDKKNIINAAMEEPKIISDILKISKIPQTSGYRKINTLIDDGILIQQGHLTTYDGKIVKKYKAIFENVNISIDRNKIIVKVLPTQESLKNSNMMQIMCS